MPFFVSFFSLLLSTLSLISTEKFSALSSNTHIMGHWVNVCLINIGVSAAIITFVYIVLNRQKKILAKKAYDRAQEMYEMNVLLEEKQLEISAQNDQLNHHRENLEKLVDERTQRMQLALQKAEDADRLKSAFLANMSHEIRTPMNAIVGFASLLNNEEIDELERKEFYSIINNNCNTLMILINDILEISLIEANQMNLRREKFNVNIILSELEYYLNMNNGKNLKIQFDNKDSEPLEIMNDPIRFRQIFTNLMNNAYKYTEQGSINFGYTKTKNGIRYYVKDTGIGIDESEYESIFNYFHKIEKDGNQFYRGAGIGLSISNKLIELMGGKIWLHSKKGAGSTFEFSFTDGDTVNNELQKHKSDVSIINELNPLADKTILVAEDDETNYILVEKILKKAQVNVIWAKNGVEAVEFVKNAAIVDDMLIVMDIKMPRMNGINAAKEIAKIQPGIPIIAVTAFAQQSNKKEILEHNFVDYIAKPIRPKKLLDVLKKYAQKEILISKSAQVNFII